MPQLTFLGTGTSTGVPQIGCQCTVCQSTNPKDHRLRTSVLYETDKGKRILIDCGPDFREQMLSLPFAPIHLVLITHEHYDHVGGLDDLRPFTALGAVPIVCNDLCAQHLCQRMPYCFVENKYPGVPQIELKVVSKEQILSSCGETIIPIEVMHGQLPIFGYRIGQMAYISDMSRITTNEMRKLKGCRLLVVNALRIESHHSHQSLSQALELIEKCRPKEAYLVHMSHQIGLHDEVQRSLPQNVFLAYDGLKLKW